MINLKSIDGDDSGGGGGGGGGGSGKRSSGRGAKGGGGLLLSIACSSSCLLLTLLSCFVGWQSTSAFVINANTLIRSGGTERALAPSPSVLGATGLTMAVGRGFGAVFAPAGGVGGRRRRKTQLGMALYHGKQTKMKPVAPKAPDMNEAIVASGLEFVRCAISVKGMDEQLGVMTTGEAFRKAQVENLDLVMINPDAEPPVVKIIDYGKFKYKQDRRKKDNKAKHKSAEMKEVKMSYKIETHDYGVRIKNAKKFVTQGHRVRLVVQFRGREQAHMDLGTKLLEQITKDLEGLALMEPKRREGPRLTMIAFPKPKT